MRKGTVGRHPKALMATKAAATVLSEKSAPADLGKNGHHRIAVPPLVPQGLTGTSRPGTRSRPTTREWYRLPTPVQDFSNLVFEREFDF